MIRYGCAIASERKYRRFAQPGIRLASGRDAGIVEARDHRSIFPAYNEILDQTTGQRDLEALVLLHEDTEITDPALERKVRSALADEQVAIVGAIGGVGVTDIDWWVHDELVGSAKLEILRPVETYGTTLLPSSRERVGERGEGEVDVVDGFLLALSPWAVRTLRFDESLGPGFHGYDVDLCFQARERGRKVVVADVDVTHHKDTLAPGEGRESWKRAHVAFRRKWETRWPLPAPPGPPESAGS